MFSQAQHRRSLRRTNTINDSLFQNIINDIQNSLHSSNNNNFRYNAPSHPPNRNNETNQSILDIINTYNYNITIYNENIRRYQEHSMELIRYIQRQESNAHEPYFHYQRPSTTPSAFVGSRSPLFTHTVHVGLGNQNFGLFQNVIVSPSPRQIETATTSFEYNPAGMEQTQCPITLEPFEDGEELCKIDHCGHVFKKTAILNWFQQNVRCPVCRYDIRDYVPNRRSNETTNDNTNIDTSGNENNNYVTNNNEDDEESVIDNDNQEQTSNTRENANDLFSNDDISTLTNALVNTLGRQLNNNLEQFIQSNFDASNSILTLDLDFPVIYYPRRR